MEETKSFGKAIWLIYLIIGIIACAINSNNYIGWQAFGLLMATIFLIIKSIISFRDGYNIKE
jgi:hypothetical protein